MREYSRRKTLQIGGTVGAGLLTGLAGCGGDGNGNGDGSESTTTVGPQTTTTTDDTTVGSIPASATMVARFEVATLLEGELLAQSVDETLSLIGEQARGYSGPESYEQVLTTVEGEAGLDPTKLSTMTMFWSKSSEQAGAVLDTEWNESTLTSALEASASGSLSETTYSGATVYTDSESTSALGVLGDGRYVVGTRGAIETVVDVESGAADPLGGTVATAFANAPDGPIRFGADVSTVDLSGEESSEPTNVQGLSEVQTVSGGLSRDGQQRTFTMSLQTTGKEAATSIDQQFDQLLRAARQQAEQNSQIGQLVDDPSAQLDAVEVASSGSTVTVSYGGDVEFVASGGMLVILAVVATFFLGIGSQQGPRAPQIAFGFEYDASNEQLEIVHEGGDSVAAGELYVRASGREQSWAALSERHSEGDNVTAGDAVTVSLEGGSQVRLIYRSGDTSAVLSMYEAE